MLHSPPVLTRVAMTCKPSCSSHVPNSLSVRGSICSSLSISTKPHSGFSLRTMAADTLSWSEPDRLPQGCPR